MTPVRRPGSFPGQAPRVDDDADAAVAERRPSRLVGSTAGRPASSRSGASTRSDGQSSGRGHSGARPKPGRHGASCRCRRRSSQPPSTATEPPTAAKPSACASRIRRLQSGSGRQPAARYAIASPCSRDLLLLGGERRPGRGDEAGLALADANDESPGLEPRFHGDRNLERGVADLGKPEAMLVDEVEGEHVVARRNGRYHPNGELESLARRHRVRQGRAAPVPDDRVAQGVEPVIGELDAFGELRAPRRRAGVLQRDAGGPASSGSERRQVEREPPHREGPGGDGVWRSGCEQRRTSLRRWSSRSSYAPAAASASTARRSGSCARRGVRCRSTARSASGTRSSRSAGSRSSARR